MEAKDRIVCALDVNSSARAVELVRQLRGSVGVFKVGLELLLSAGIDVVRQVIDAGADRIFLDAKLHDISHTVAGAMRGVVRSRAWCVTLHAAGGAAMLRAARQAALQEAEAAGIPRPLLLGVTLLTSLSAETLHEEMHVTEPVEHYVAHLACLAQDAGCDGVIVSPHEIATVRQMIPDPNFLIITPGVRPAGSATGDQARIMTPGEAIRLGASYLVIGRPIVAAENPVDAAARIAAEIAADLPTA